MIHTFIFTNGCKLIYEETKNVLPISSIQGFVKVGSIYETDNTRGISHFIEHMCFKGTQKIPKSKDIFIKYDEVGAYFNAYTEKDHTCYSVKCHDDFLEHCLEILSDLMLNSTFAKKEYVLEKKIVVEETVRNEDNPENAIGKLMDRMLYSGSSYEYPVDTLAYHTPQSLDYKRMIEMYDNLYQPVNMVVSVSSHLPFSKIKQIMNRSFFTKTKSKEMTLDPNKYYIEYAIQPQSSTKYLMELKRGIQSTHISIGFRTCNFDSNDKYVLNLLSKIIGGSMSGKMFMLLREQNGLTYKSNVYTTNYKHSGDFTFYTTTNNTKLMHNQEKKGVLPLLIGLLNDLVKKGITQNELTVAKGYLKGKMTIELEDSETQTIHNGYELLLHDTPASIIPFSHVYNTYYANITKKQVNDIIKKYLKKTNMSVCLLGEFLPSLEKVKSECEKFVE